VQCLKYPYLTCQLGRCSRQEHLSADSTTMSTLHAQQLLTMLHTHDTLRGVPPANNTTMSRHTPAHLHAHCSTFNTHVHTLHPCTLPINLTALPCRLPTPYAFM
jgi:hypothetical protein